MNLLEWLKRSVMQYYEGCYFYCIDKLKYDHKRAFNTAINRIPVFVLFISYGLFLLLLSVLFDFFDLVHPEGVSRSTSPFKRIPVFPIAIGLLMLYLWVANVITKEFIPEIDPETYNEAERTERVNFWYGRSMLLLVVFFSLIGLSLFVQWLKG